MRKSAVVLLTVLGIVGCQSSGLAPIEIDLSKRTPAATPTVTPTAIPTSHRASATPPMPTAPATLPTPEPAAAGLVAPSLAAEAPLKPEGVIDAQLAAYNHHDVEDFLRSYASDAVLYDFPDHVRQSGIAQIRSAYTSELTQSSASQIAVSTRIPQGNFVIDHETVSGVAAHEVASVVVIYEVHDGKIRRVWFLR